MTGTTDDLAVVLPYPPTVNTYWRRVGRRTLISAAGRRYRTRVREALLAHCLLLGQIRRFGRQPLRLEVDVFPPDRRRRDLDNILKALIDALEQAGLFEDDSQIEALSIHRREIHPEGLVVVVIRAVKDGPKAPAIPD